MDLWQTVSTRNVLEMQSKVREKEASMQRRTFSKELLSPKVLCGQIAISGCLKFKFGLGG